MVNSRIKNAYNKLAQENLDALIVCCPANISYLLKFPSRDSYLLFSRQKNVYFTDSRYTEEAGRHLGGIAEIKKTNGSVFKAISSACCDLGLKRIGFEERYLPYAEYNKIHEGFKKKGAVVLVPTHSLIEEFRQIKDEGEIEKIKKAVKITLLALRFIEDFISAGKKEIEVVAELERFIRYHGADNSAFDIIVASGANSSFPHHIPSEKKIKNNEPVLVDIGIDYMGYKSDLTRVFFLGKITSLAQKIHDIVLQAQERAINKVKPDCPIAGIDKASRQYITQKGYGAFFGHNTGHGIGLEIHEEPHISGNQNSLLRPGMVFTIEPAIYLPRKFGIRIEDMVLVTKKGREILGGTIHK